MKHFDPLTGSVAVPRLMHHDTGVWYFWDGHATPTADELERHVLWQLVMESTFKVDRSLLPYVERLEPRLTEPPVKWFRWKRDEKGWPCGMEECEGPAQ